jgi:hypothetical protein
MHKVIISVRIVNLFILERSNTVQVNKRPRCISKRIISQKIRFPLFVVMKTSNVAKTNMPIISSEQNKDLKSLDLTAIYVSPSCARNRHFPKRSVALRKLKR